MKVIIPNVNDVSLSSLVRRAAWTGLTDAQLLAQCEVDTYRASGPGGQKRNKTSSAVRLRHEASGLLVIAEESRSQHENKAKALQRLRQAFFLKWRQTLSDDDLAGATSRAEIRAARSGDSRLVVGRRDLRYWPAVGVILDVLLQYQGRVADAARMLDTSTANLVDFLAKDPKGWEQLNQMRVRFGHKKLHRND
jgi:peptide chain release factor-like protein